MLLVTIPRLIRRNDYSVQVVYGVMHEGFLGYWLKRPQCEGEPPTEPRKQLQYHGGEIDHNVGIVQSMSDDQNTAYNLDSVLQATVVPT